MLSLHQLRCFLATYELGSLTAAAEQLGYAQPSVSEQIRGAGEDARRRAVPAGRPGRRADDGRRLAAAARRARRSRRPRRPAGRAAGDRPRDRHDPLRDVRHRPAVRRCRAGRRRAGPPPGRPRRAGRPELQRGPGGPAPRPDRGRDDRRHRRRKRGAGGDAGGPRRAGLHQRRPGAHSPHRSPRSGWPRRRWSCRRPPGGRRLHPADPAQMLHETGLQPADPDRGRGRRDGGRAGRPWAWPTRSSRGRRRAAAPPAGAERPVAAAAPAPVRHHRDRAPRPAPRSRPPPG